MVRRPTPTRAAAFLSASPPACAPADLRPGRLRVVAAIRPTDAPLPTSIRAAPDEVMVDPTRRRRCLPSRAAAVYHLRVLHTLLPVADRGISRRPTPPSPALAGGGSGPISPQTVDPLAAPTPAPPHPRDRLASCARRAPHPIGCRVPPLLRPSARHRRPRLLPSAVASSPRRRPLRRRCRRSSPSQGTPRQEAPTPHVLRG
ncbi:hypothetical protein BS78_07G027900 [Paspalum vaginatum]|nr:hypothetical protein BS78_07G027900 [Paspalum vaginatum]